MTIQYIKGFVTMPSGDYISIVDPSEDDGKVELQIGNRCILLSEEELRYLSEISLNAADRAKDRQMDIDERNGEIDQITKILTHAQGD